MYDLNIKIVDLPLSVRGATVKDKGVYYIFINGKYNKKERKEIFAEEVEKLKDVSIENIKKAEIMLR